MSLSLSVRNSNDRNRLAGSDILFAIILHLLVIIAALIVNWWQMSHEPEPLKRIEVRMISAAELKKMQQPPKPAARPEPAPKPIKKATEPTPKPSLKPATKTPAKPAEKHDDFDPFAPVQSSSDRTEPTNARTGGGDLATLMGKQLSTQEIDVYIARMREAVERKWKVPAGIDRNITDPVVEMILHPGGTIASVRIMKSSGHAALDRTLEAAIRAAAPFDFLPQRQFEAFRVNTITFRPLKGDEIFAD